MKQVCIDPAWSVDLWVMPTTALTPQIRALSLSLINRDEVERYRRFVDEEARDQFLIARAMVRQLLSRHADVDPADWEFDANEYGRPHVSYPDVKGVPNFNVSHTQGLAAVVLSDTPDVGVDTERLGRALSFDDLSQSLFSEHERQWIDRFLPHMRQEAFYEVWTLREAYAKARGLGFSLPYESFRIDFTLGEPTLQCDARCQDDGGRWQLQTLKPTSDHIVALAKAKKAAVRR